MGYSSGVIEWGTKGYSSGLLGGTAEVLAGVLAGVPRGYWVLDAVLRDRLELLTGVLEGYSREYSTGTLGVLYGVLEGVLEGVL